MMGGKRHCRKSHRTFELVTKFQHNLIFYFYLTSYFLASGLFVLKILLSSCFFDCFCFLMGQEMAVYFLNRSFDFYLLNFQIVN